MNKDQKIITDMPPDELKKSLEWTSDWIVNYFTNLDNYPVISDCKPGEIKKQISSHVPEMPESMESILTDFAEIIPQGTTLWNHPGFMAYFANSSTGPGIISEALIATLNQNAMLWKTSPVATELEEVMITWLTQLLNLPPIFKGVITDTASVSSLVAIATARERLSGLSIRQKGLSGRSEVPRLRLYTSEQSHSSIEKAAIILGVGQEGVCKIRTDESYAMDVIALQQTIDEDRKSGWLPFCVVATLGTTSTTAVDPVNEISRICQKENLWLHADAAYGGAIGAVPELRHILAGWEKADSIVVNPHKWLFVPMDCSVLFVQDPKSLQQAFSLIPEYLQTEDTGTNYMDWGIQLGRRFRALKLWMTIRYFGANGIASLIREHVQMAQQFATWVQEQDDFEIMAPHPFSVVCFRAHPNDIDDGQELDDLNMRLLDKVNVTGKFFLSSTRVNNALIIRVAIGNIHTSQKHIDQICLLLQDCLDL
jgi:aromatic-L-amino-acid/L-tryptophan decarboxylase